MGRIGSYIAEHGVIWTMRKAAEKGIERFFHPGDKQYRAQAASEAELQRQRDNDPGDVGGISVCIPTYNTKPEFLQALADSLRAQNWPHWQAVLADGHSTKPETLEALRALAEDKRFKVVFSDTNDGISGNTNKAVAAADGEWIALCDHDDLLAPDALWRMADAIVREEPDMLYSDEDRVTEDGRYHLEAHRKPGFSPENLRCGNYICHLMCIRKQLVNEVGLLRPAFDGSQDHDLALRCSEKARKVVHVPYILYHWRIVGSSMSHQHLDKCLDAGARAAAEQMERLGIPGKTEMAHRMVRPVYSVPGTPTVDIIAVDCGDPVLWLKALRFLRKVQDRRVHISVVSPDPTAADGLDGVTFFRWSASENLYAALNRAAADSDADYLFFLHGSVLPTSDDWLQELLSLAALPGVGAAAPVIREGGKVLTAGYAVGMETAAAPVHNGEPAHSGGYHSSLWQHRNVSAVSSACCMIARERFVPFDESYSGGLGAVDWCLRLRSAGYRHIVTPYAIAEAQDSPAFSWLWLTKPAAEEELQRFRTAHGSAAEPYYPAAFGRKDARYR